MENGPGKPRIALALKLMAQRKLKEEDNKKGLNKNRRSEDETSIYTNRLKEGEEATGFNDPEYIKRSFGSAVQPKFTKSDKESYIRAGLVTEKNGDVFYTETYRKLNKEGKVASYLSEFLKREKSDEKFINENAGKKLYESDKPKVANALMSMKNFK